MDPTKDSGTPLGPPNQRIAHYVILDRLGEGGMGIVYRARDTRLDRLVALKTLRPESMASALRKQRFVQEAKAASALNHPNITHIYDIGSAGEIDFIAMEYVQGASLEQLIKNTRLPWRDVVNYAVQIADALDVAHTAGILHRDLKPGNVMITERGLVKVLDFGLAKLMEPEENRNPELEVTKTEYGPETVRGTTVGTPRYMSPEQASGRKLDARSDIFSLGVMLYQMATGAIPFDGDSTAAVLASILRDEPQPPGLICPEVPLEVERIIMRCLRKDSKRRFQNMMDVKLALDDIKEEPGTITLRTASVPAVRAPRGKMWFLVAAAVVIAITGIAAGTWWMLRKNGPPVRESELVRLTSDPGLSTDPAISTDGKLIAYASDRAGDGNLNIWVQQVGGGEPIRLTHHQADDYQPDFSPDGTQIVFRSDRDGGGIYIVSTLGGEERRIADAGRRPRFSPDGRWIAFWAGTEGLSLESRAGAARVYVMSSAGGPPRQIEPAFSNAGWPVWSPDSKSVLFVGVRNAAVKETFGWWVAPLDAGKAVQVRPPPETPIGRGWFPYVWQADRVIFSEQREGAANILEVPFSAKTPALTAAPHRLTLGMTREDDPSLSADGRLVFASVTYNVDVYSLAVDANLGKVTGQLQRLTTDAATDRTPSISMDGTRIAFNSGRLGAEGIWTKDLKTGKESPLVRPTGSVPFVSPDGSLVAWDVSGVQTLAEPFEGGATRRICQDCGNICGWSTDGRKSLFTDYSSHSFIGVLDLASGQKTILKHPKLSVYPRSFSPDDRWIAATAENPLKIVIVPFHPGQPVAEADWIQVTDGAHRDGGPRWSPDGKLLYFTSDRDGLTCIWAQPLDPDTKHPVGEPFAVFHIHGALLRMRPYITPFSLSKDKLVFSLEERAGNIWMLKQ